MTGNYLNEKRYIYTRYQNHLEGIVIAVKELMCKNDVLRTIKTDPDLQELTRIAQIGGLLLEPCSKNASIYKRTSKISRSG